MGCVCTHQHFYRYKIIIFSKKGNSLNFQLSGNFLDVGNFIEILEKNSSQVKLQFCSINLDSLDPRGVVAKLEYLTYGGAGQ